MEKTAYTQQQCCSIGKEIIENRIKYLDFAVSNYLDNHQYSCQEADREDMKQEVLMRLCKIIPESFDSERHFKNWCHRFAKLYSINAFRDLCKKWKDRQGEILVADFEEKIIRDNSCRAYLNKNNLHENCHRKYLWFQDEDQESIETALMLANSLNPISDFSEKHSVSRRVASERLKRKGFRTKKLTFL